MNRAIENKVIAATISLRLKKGGYKNSYYANFSNSCELKYFAVLDILVIKSQSKFLPKHFGHKYNSNTHFTNVMNVFQKIQKSFLKPGHIQNEEKLPIVDFVWKYAQCFMCT